MTYSTSCPEANSKSEVQKTKVKVPTLQLGAKHLLRRAQKYSKHLSHTLRPTASPWRAELQKKWPARHTAERGLKTSKTQLDEVKKLPGGLPSHTTGPTTKTVRSKKTKPERERHSEKKFVRQATINWQYIDSEDSSNAVQQQTQQFSQQMPSLPQNQMPSRSTERVHKRQGQFKPSLTPIVESAVLAKRLFFRKKHMLEDVRERHVNVREVLPAIL